jgi:hypothetical protein
MTDNKPKPLDWSAQLVLLRGLTQRFGSLHSAQVLQLRLWPFVVDSSLDKTEAHVDIEGKFVNFIWIGSKKKIDAKYQYRLKTLDSNVKFLLGEDWSMSVVCDGVTIFPLDTNNGTRNNRSRSGKPRVNKNRKTRTKKSRANRKKK